MFEILLGIIIAIALPLICLLIAYWAFSRLYKTYQMSNKNGDTKLVLELESLKNRVELLERKLDNK